jgi:hypothetical protein
VALHRNGHRQAPVRIVRQLLPANRPHR